MMVLTLYVVVCGLVVTAAQKFTIDLQSGEASNSTAMSANGLEWEYKPPSSTCRSRCDLQGVLKLTFNSTRKRVEIDLKFSSVVKGVPFHIVELDKNESCVANLSSMIPKRSSNSSLSEILRSCGNSSLRLSEVLSREKNISIYSEDKYSNETDFKKPANETKQRRLHFEPEYLGYGISLSIKDKELVAENGEKSLTLRAEKLFASNASSPLESSYDKYVLYLGMNRKVDDYRPSPSSEGLCSATISWHSE